jgi:hypothetical protein|tara:strand:+ start:385 stop:537 length:153 start_codon:yes stop_codon:yes gene_type:complete
MADGKNVKQSTENAPQGGNRKSDGETQSKNEPKGKHAKTESLPQNLDKRH